MKVNRGEVDDYYVKDGHLPIISREVWDTACALRQERSQKMGKFRGMKNLIHGQKPVLEYALIVERIILLRD